MCVGRTDRYLRRLLAGRGRLQLTAGLQPSAMDLARDDEYGDIPLVTYDGGPANELSLRVRMYSCQLEPCAFGVAVFREP